MTTAGKTFPQHFRLTDKAEFDLVFHRGNRVNSSLFTAIVLSNNLNHPRLGLAISRRSANSAVARNRLKRQIRETFRHEAENLTSIDVVVLARPEAATQNNKICQESLGELWNKVNQVCALSSSH